jgi:hypothetical protein
MGTTASSHVGRAEVTSKSISFQKCLVATWKIPDWQLSPTGLVHDSSDDWTWVSSFNSKRSRGLLRTYCGTHPDVSPVFENRELQVAASGLALVPASRRSRELQLLAHLDNNLISVSALGDVRPVEYACSRSSWGHRSIVAVACDSRGHIAHISYGVRTVYVHALSLPSIVCDYTVPRERDVNITANLHRTCPRPCYGAPTISASQMCGGENLLFWTRLVALTYDSQDRLYVLDLNMQDTTRLILWLYDTVTSEWQWAADLSYAYQDVQVAVDEPFYVSVDAFRDRAYVAHSTCVHVAELKRTTHLLAGHGRVGGRTNGPGNDARFGVLRSCALRTRPLDLARDVAPTVTAIRMATADIDTGYPWPHGISDIVEQYARGLGDPAVGLLLADHRNRTIRQLDFLS